MLLSTLLHLLDSYVFGFALVYLPPFKSEYLVLSKSLQIQKKVCISLFMFSTVELRRIMYCFFTITYMYINVMFHNKNLVHILPEIGIVVCSHQLLI